MVSDEIALFASRPVPIGTDIEYPFRKVRFGQNRNNHGYNHNTNKEKERGDLTFWSSPAMPITPFRFVLTISTRVTSHRGAGVLK